MLGIYKGNKVKNNLISRRFASYYPVAELLKSYKHFLKESYRVLKEDLKKETTDYKKIMEISKEIEENEMLYEKMMERFFELEAIKEEYIK